MILNIQASNSKLYKYINLLSNKLDKLKLRKTCHGYTIGHMGLRYYWCTVCNLLIETCKNKQD